jgi:hypothetical protein
MSYEVSHLLEDFELMKNVQNLIEENAHRVGDPTKPPEKKPPQPEVNLFSNHYEPYSKD